MNWCTNGGERSYLLDALFVVGNFVSRSTLLSEPKDPATKMEKEVPVISGHRFILEKRIPDTNVDLSGCTVV